MASQITDARAAAEQLLFLARLDVKLRGYADPSDITLAAASLLGEHLQVDRCAYADIETDEDTMNLTGNYIKSANIKSIVGQLRFTDFGAEVLQLMRENKPYVVNDIDTHQPFVGDANAYHAAQIRSVICVPLHKNGHFVAAMAVHMATPRVWTKEEVDLVIIVANRCWESIERAKIERYLRLSEERFRTAVLATSDIVWTTNAEGLIVAPQAGWETFTGRPFSEYQGVGWIQSIHAEDRDRTLRTWQTALDRKNPYEVQHRVLRHDGQYRICRAKGVPVLNEDQSVREWIGVHTDVTEQIAVQEHLKHEGITAAHLAAIVESSDDIIISKDLNGVINSWNKTAERIFGYRAEEAIGRHISLIIPKDRLPEEEKIISSVRSGRRVNHFETVRQAKDGSLIELSITVSPVKDITGKIIGASKIARDITERKSTDRQLEEERSTLEILNQLAPTLASTLDLESLVQIVTDEATKVTGAAYGAFFYNVLNEDGKAFLLYSLSGAPKEAFSHLGMPRATAIFKPIFIAEGTILSDDITADSRYGHNSPYKGMPPGHLPLRSYLAVSVVSRNGDVIGGLFFGHPDVGVFQERDARIVEGIAALAAVGIDNARLYDEVKLGQKKAEEANRAKTDFLATMSHEIRTPMNAIIGLSSILAISNPLSPKQREYIKTLQTSADALLSLINDLLDISKIEARSVELENEPFSLSVLMQEISSMMAVRSQEKGLKFVADTENIGGLVFMGDSTRIRQIILNLCSNAIKFTDAGSVNIIVKSDKHTKFGYANVTIIVQDTGIGIPFDKQSAIFEEFVQADTSISRRYGGTGLGLTITKRLVEAMEGQISMTSEVAKGSSFTVTLPLRLASEAAILEDKTLQAHTHSADTLGKVLLVEDYEPNVLVATAYLEEIGYDFDVVNTGAQALDIVESNSYVAILMDVQMPEMNGFEVTKHIRALEKKKQRTPVPIIGITAHAMAGDRERCLAVGMNDYLAKPYSLKDLNEKLLQFGEVSEKRQRS